MQNYYSNWNQVLKEQLRILTGKKALSNKTPTLTKSMNMDYPNDSWYMKSTLYKRLLNWNKIFKIIKQLLAKLCSLWWVHFVLTILFILKLASDMAVLYGNDEFSILVLSSSLFSKRFSFSRKSISKLKYWKGSKFSLIVT